MHLLWLFKIYLLNFANSEIKWFVFTSLFSLFIEIELFCSFWYHLIPCNNLFKETNKFFNSLTRRLYFLIQFLLNNQINSSTLNQTGLSIFKIFCYFIKIDSLSLWKCNAKNIELLGWQLVRFFVLLLWCVHLLRFL